MRTLADRLRVGGQGIIATFVVAALANCGGGERPAAETNPPPPPAIPDDGTVTISPLTEAGLVFGDNSFVNSGAQAQEKVVTLSNTTQNVVNFTAKLTSGTDYYKLNPEAGGIPINGKATIQVIPNPIPQEADVATDLFAGTLEITTDVKREVEEPPTVIRLHQTARGAIITSTLQPTLDFGDVKVGTTQPLQFSFTNSGNVDVTATFSLGGQVFKIDQNQTSTAILQPGQAVNKTVTLSPPATDPYTDSLAIDFNTTAVFCRAKPGATAVKGRGTSSVGVSPGTLNFGQVDCGTTATPQDVTITSTVEMTFTPTLGLGPASPFLLQSGSGTALALGSPVSMDAGAQYTLRVVPKTVPIPSPTTANGVGDTLSITTSVGSTHTVQLQQTARGAIFSFDKVEIKRDSDPLNNVSNNAFIVRNGGNAAAEFSLAVVPLDGAPAPPAGAFTLVNAGLQAGAVGDNNQSLTIVAPHTSETQVSAAIRISSSGVLCRSLPTDLPASVKTMKIN